LLQVIQTKIGRSVHEYQQLARIVASLDDVRSTKIEPIARGVGYHSTKNFYSAFRRLIGRTPGSIECCLMKTPLYSRPWLVSS
jgi:methylphosphotriester-DNA--protein-cysteine methyltransferase